MDLALLTSQYLSGTDCRVLASDSFAIYFPRRMHQIPDAYTKVRELLLPAVELLTGHMEEYFAEALRGIPCMSCGDPTIYWLSHTQISGFGVSGAEHQYTYRMTSVPVCKVNRKDCARRGRNLTAEINQEPEIGKNRAPVVCCNKCRKRDFQLDKGVKMKLCGGCRLAVYCSVECQRAHWGDHKQECQKNKRSLEAIGSS